MKHLPALLLIQTAIMALLPVLVLAQDLDCVSRSGSTGTVLIPDDVEIDIEGRPIAEGQQLTAHGEDGRCVGLLPWQGDAQALTVWGTAPFSEQTDGLESGEAMSFRLYDPADPSHYHELTVTLAQDSELYQSSKHFVSNGVYRVEAIRSQKVRVEDQQLTPPAPNPFSSETRLTLTLEEPQDVQVEVYDVQGRRVTELHRGPMERGANALRLEAEGLSSGTYFIVARGQNFQQTRRTVLIR